jgi:Uma2 family endonuclease
MTVSEATYKTIALEDPSGHWELHCGHLRQKPDMTADHNQTISRLFGRLFQQLDERDYSVRSNLGHLRRSSQSYYIPDVYVVPVEATRRQLGTMKLEVYDVPLPLVIEVWSPSTGDYDVETKLLEYQQRGDLEIWLVHPYEHTVTAWVRQPDGQYAQSIFEGGTVRPSVLPDVAIDLDALFA